MDTTNPTLQTRCRTLFGAAIRTVDELRRCGLDGHTSRALLLVPTALMRPAELVSPAVTVRDGSLHVPGSAVGRVNLPGRTVPLGGAARAVLGGEGNLYELLGVERHGRGPFLRTLSAAYTAAAPEGLETLEQLWAALTAAALAAQPSGAWCAACRPPVALVTDARERPPAHPAGGPPTSARSAGLLLPHDVGLNPALGRTSPSPCQA